MLNLSCFFLSFVDCSPFINIAIPIYWVVSLVWTSRVFGIILEFLHAVGMLLQLVDLQIGLDVLNKLTGYSINKYF